MKFSERLRSLMEERSTSWNTVSKSTGIGKNQQKYWEDHDSLPDGKSLVKLAEYFEVSVDYLLGFEIAKGKSLTILDNPDLVLTSDEKWFILKLRQLDREGRTVVEGTLISEVRRIETKKETSSVG